MRFLPLLSLAGSMISFALAATPEAAEPLSPAAPPGAALGTAIDVAQAGSAQPGAGQPSAARPARTGTTQIPANGQRIVLEVGKGTLIRLAAPAATVFVANPDVADVQVKSPTPVYISAKGPGDSVLLNAPVLVEHDLSRLRSSLKQLVPGERISVDSVDGNLVMSGTVSDAGRADKARALAASIAGEVKGAQVINRMTVATPNQVNLRVRIAEVQVNKLNEIGVNWSKMSSNLAFQTVNPVTIM